MMSEVIVKPPLNRILFSLLGREGLVYEWWKSPNKAFNGKTPDEIYQSGPEGRKQVSNYLYAQVNGDYY